MAISDLLLLERLSDRDLALIARAAGAPESHADRAAGLRHRPELIEEWLARQALFETLYGRGEVDPFVIASPFLAFAALLAHAPSLLEGVAFIPEWLGYRQRLPVFEVEPLREFLTNPLHRLFLADLLSSYTHVASGSVWVKAGQRWRHRRFSELDPSQFAELILSVPPEQRLPLHRRLGDLSLFLTGVFPDHVGARALPPITVERLRRAVADGGSEMELRPERRAGDLGAVGLLEWVGRRSYRLAWEAVEYRETGYAAVLADMAQEFRHARMILTFLTDQYLFRHRERWFPLAS